MGGTNGSGLEVDPVLRAFLVDDVLAPLAIPPETFFDGLAAAIATFGPRTLDALRERDRLQAAIDRWHLDHHGEFDPASYRRFLAEIGYLTPEPDPFVITTEGVDPEIAATNGPQLVVPATNARYALNAANARWGSLYDALYGTDALGSSPSPGPYDHERGRLVIQWVRGFLDRAVPLAEGSHADASSYLIRAGDLRAVVSGREVPLAEPGAFRGHVGDADAPTTVLLEHHRLGIQIQIDRESAVGRSDQAGVTDVLLESAVSTIVDLEDSVACVDAADKVAAYRTLLGLMRGDLTADVDKQGAVFVRSLAENLAYTAADGTAAHLRTRSLLLARIVGHHMFTDAVRMDGEEVPEGIVDSFVVAAIAAHDRFRPVPYRNSRHGSIYIVRPKMHGQHEVQLTCDVFAAVERTLGLAPSTVKLGIMDEERRTTLNLEQCIRAASDRVVFINTGFLDRTGDEIHTSMSAGPMVRKATMKSEPWIRAYEHRNVEIGLRCGFAGRAQIGKGMWAAPDRMAAMLAEKLAHPLAGASCAWVPSPTAATLHATHYHEVDVSQRQRELAAGGPVAGIDDLLRIPLADASGWTGDEVTAELENNLQGILGYVVRWVDQGVGCSKVPDLDDVGLMEDRATCRISSQHVANWLAHGIVSEDDVQRALRRMAQVVDRQNEGDPLYHPMAPSFDGPAFRAASELVFHGTASANGYTESTLHRHRRLAKSAKEAS